MGSGGSSSRDLTPLLRPRSVAVIGASDDPTKIRGRILNQIIAGGYRGAIHPIHPARREIRGLRAYPAIAEAPGPIDLALIAIPAESVLPVLEECAAAGVKSAIVYSSGFAEEGASGRAQQERMREIAQARGMTILGPNSVGVLSLAEPFVATFSPAVDFARLPALHADTASPHVAMVSQSGGLGFALAHRGMQRGLLFGTVVNTGNEADLDACDVIDHLVEVERTRIVLLFLEEIRRGRRFVELAERARARGKLLVAAKMGRSAAGARAALSHTASRTGADAVHDAVFRRCGVIRADDLDGMLDIASAATLCPALRGRRVGIVTISGGVGGWMADTLEAHGLEVAEFSAALQRRIRAFLPSYGAAFNPIDITAQALQNDHRVRAIEALAEAEEVDAIVVVASLVAESPFAKDKAELAAILARRLKPILFYSYSLPSERAVADLQEIGAPLFPNLRGAALALAALAGRDAAAGDEALAALGADAARELDELYGIALPEHQRRGDPP